MSRRPLVHAPFHYDGRRCVITPRRRKTISGQGARGARLVPAASAFLAHDVFQTSTGETIVHAQQYYRGLRVFGSTMVATKKGRRVTASTSSFDPSGALPSRPTITQEAAIHALMAFLKRRRVVSQQFAVEVRRVLQDATLAERPSFVDMRRGFDGPVRMHVEICPMPGEPLLAWVIACSLRDRRRFQALVTAATPRPRVLKVAQVNTCAFQADWVPTPGPAVNEAFPQPVFATPDGSAIPASAWLKTAGQAEGPNVECYKANQTAVEPLGSLNVDNTFVWGNMLHDFFAAFGFDGASHAFEVTDPLEVVRHSQNSVGAGDFDNFADGSRPTMRLFGSPHGGSHAAGDPSVFIHEYTHGVSSRLVGGAAVSEPFTTREAQGLAEGISDYFAITVLNWIVRAKGAAAPVTTFGELFRPGGGIRSYAGFTGVMPPNLPHDIYKIGRVWCAAMLDGRASVAAMLTDDDAADRYLWQALINMLKALKLANHPNTQHLTLAASKQALRTAARAIEDADATLAGATARVMSALTARNICRDIP